jgi:hypothetical protein
VKLGQGRKEHSTDPCWGLNHGQTSLQPLALNYMVATFKVLNSHGWLAVIQRKYYQVVIMKKMTPAFLSLEALL